MIPTPDERIAQLEADLEVTRRQLANTQEELLRVDEALGDRTTIADYGLLLSDEVRSLRAAREYAVRERDVFRSSVRKLREALREYGRHRERCNGFPHPGECDCGFSALLNESSGYDSIASNPWKGFPLGAWFAAIAAWKRGKEAPSKALRSLLAWDTERAVSTCDGTGVLSWREDGDIDECPGCSGCGGRR